MGYKSYVLRTFPVLAAPVALMLGPAACDSDNDEADAQQAVRDFVEATNDRDGERLCGELVTQAFKEQATGATGDRVDQIGEDQLEKEDGSCKLASASSG